MCDRSENSQCLMGLTIVLQRLLITCRMKEPRPQFASLVPADLIFPIADTKALRVSARRAAVQLAARSGNSLGCPGASCQRLFLTAMHAMRRAAAT